MLLRKGAYPYEYMDEWEKFNEASLHEKEEFYSNLIGADCMHAKRVGKDFEIKTSAEYHDLFLQKDTLLLADIFENFRKIFLKLYELNPAKFLSAPGIK